MIKRWAMAVAVVVAAFGAGAATETIGGHV